MFAKNKHDDKIVWFCKYNELKECAKESHVLENEIVAFDQFLESKNQTRLAKQLAKCENPKCSSKKAKLSLYDPVPAKNIFVCSVKCIPNAFQNKYTNQSVYARRILYK